MILIILFSAISFCTIFAIIRSGKPAKHILAEIKYELIYQIVGAKALFEDILMKKRNVIDLPNKSGQFALVTGGSRGIGVEIVKMLMQCDMHVIIGCRNVSAGEKVETLIRKQGIKTGQLRCFQLDTSSNKSVRAFAAKIKEKYSKLNLLINNAGIMFGPYTLTEDGIESQFAVNYVGHFLLSHLLLPLLKAAGTETHHSRIVNVSSVAHYVSDMNYDDINFKEQYVASQAYAQSKLAQVLFTIHLQNKFTEEKLPIQVHAVHPGVVDTDLFNGTPIKKLFPWLPGLMFKNASQGATSVLYCALSAKLEGNGGNYLSNCKIFPYSSCAVSKESQEKLFELSKNLVNITEFGVV